MATHQKYLSLVNVAGFLSDLADFMAANGWFITTDTSTRVVGSKNGHSLRFEYVSTTSIRLYCTPAGGVENTSTIPINELNAGTQYCFISGEYSLFIGRVYSTIWTWGGFSEVVSKIGAWSGGCCIFGISTNGSYIAADYSTYQSIFYNGAWSTPAGTPVAGSLKGSIGFDVDIVLKQPSDLNGAILPVPVKLYLCNSTITLLHPIGWISDLFRTKGGNIYIEDDIISISGVDHIIKPHTDVMGSKDLLFKLGN